MIIDNSPIYLTKEHVFRSIIDQGECCRFRHENLDSPLVILADLLREKTDLTVEVNWNWNIGRIGNEIRIYGDKQDWEKLKKIVETVCKVIGDEQLVLKRDVIISEVKNFAYWEFRLFLNGKDADRTRTLEHIKPFLENYN